ncbi:MAG: cation:proton antiporter [Planctomycetes bacterium]|nr:cation:proton antiporter [Planctomycetota bacterium]
MTGTSNRRVAWRWIAVAAVLLVWPGALGITWPEGAAREEAIAAVTEEAAGAQQAGAGGESVAAAPNSGSETAGEHTAGGEGHGGGHADPVGPVLLGVVIIILAARIGGHLFELAGQPAVLGELVVGVILGNLTLVGITQLEFLKVDYSSGVAPHGTLGLAGVTIDHLSRIGVVLLLFQVGLETSVNEMRRVGLSAFLVALFGVVAPIGLGWGCGAVLLPNHHWTVHMYLGATLAATSVGITARVLQDLGKSTTKEAQIILGAAVIDDVMGLVVLAAAQGIITALNNPTGGEFGAAELIAILAKAVGFLFGALLLGQFISRPLFKFASILRGKGLLVITGLAICFLFAWAANVVGLAPIVGAFAAGLILEKVQYRELAGRDGYHELEEAIEPIAALLVPIFFVEMGIHVDLRSFTDPAMLGLGAALTVAAIIGKQVCSFGVLDKSVDRLSVGLGMIPRGEVGLIFAAIGLQLKIGSERVVDDHTYSALVAMVMITTMVTPPLLKWSLTRRNHAAQE